MKGKKNAFLLIQIPNQNIVQRIPLRSNLLVNEVIGLVVYWNNKYENGTCMVDIQRYYRKKNIMSIIYNINIFLNDQM